MVSGHILPHSEEPKFRETATFQYLPPDSNVANLHDNMKSIMGAIVNILCIMTSNGDGAAMAQWWERSPLTSVSRVQFSNPASYFMWVKFVVLVLAVAPRVFLRVLQFSSLLKTQHFYLSVSIWQIDCYVLPFLNKDVYRFLSFTSKTNTCI